MTTKTTTETTATPTDAAGSTGDEPAMTRAERNFRKHGFTSIRTGGELEITPVPGRMLELPAPVHAASVALDEALKRSEHAERELVQARAVAREAQERDATAVREAVEAGRKLPKPTMAQAVADEVGAAKARIAAHELVVEGQRKMALALFDCAKSWQPELVRAQQENEKAVRETVERLGELSAEAVHIAQAIEQVQGVMSPSPMPRFSIRTYRQSRSAREKLDRLIEDALRGF